MIWKYDSLLKEYQLVYNNSILAKIQTKPRKKSNGLIVKTLISGIYFSYKTQLKLEKQNKEWVCYKKKFKTKEDALSYIERKKKVVINFINAREKEI